MFKLSDRSESNLIGVHPDLTRVVYRAIEITPYDFGINGSSVRTMKEQKRLFSEGKSQTMNSRHVIENNECHFSCAIDFNVYVNNKITWDVKYFRKVAQAFVTAAIELSIPIELGVLWESFVDGPHVQLSKEFYP